MPENLVKFRGLCRQLLAEGIKPTATEFAKRGWPYVEVPYFASYARAGHPPVATPGSGTTWISGKYTAARREELEKAGYVLTKPGGIWIKP